jgi:3-oxosteroid 1-dehydrogenase
MAMNAGAMLGNMREAWWMPAVVVREDENSMGRQLLAAPRSVRRCIIVNRKGRRFTNEAANYNAFGNAFHEFDVSAFSYANLPCWMIFDDEYARCYGYSGGRFGVPGVVSDWVMRANSWRELAERLEIPAANLEATVARWNENVAAGHDPDFLRGESAYDRWWGDPNRKRQKDGTLGPLDVPPFYAVEVHSGVLGTKGGPQTDADARVIDLEGRPIAGLYAAGNVMASPFGMTYCGPGGTLGQGMVFGYLAGRHAASHVKRE